MYDVCFPLLRTSYQFSYDKQLIKLLKQDIPRTLLVVLALCYHLQEWCKIVSNICTGERFVSEIKPYDLLKTMLNDCFSMIMLHRYMGEYIILVYLVFMSQTVLYFLNSTSVLSFYIDVVLTLFNCYTRGVSVYR